MPFFIYSIFSYNLFFPSHIVQIFGSEPRDEETEVWLVDIAYDEVAERHYKESEVRSTEATSNANWAGARTHARMNPSIL